MKVKALRNLGGAVTAYQGQEIEVTEIQARDLIEQGVVELASGNVQEMQTLMSKNTEQMAQEQELATFAMEEVMRAEAEMAQKQANQQSEQREQAKQQIREQANQMAQQKSQQSQSQFSTQSESQTQAQPQAKKHNS